MSVYEIQSLCCQTLFQKLFKIQPKANFLIELQNLLAKNENNLSIITQSDIEKLKMKYKISQNDFKYEREILLDKFIALCLYDNRLSDNEKNTLSHLCQLLDLSDEYLQKRIVEEGKLIYRYKVQAIVSDNIITDNERNELSTLRKEFNLSESDGKDIYIDESKKKIQAFVDRLISKRRMSPDEEKTLDDMISGLNIKATFTDNGLQKLRHFWEIENADLPALFSPINLQKAEFLHYSAKIEWWEERTKTTHVYYGGLTSTFRITKGLSLRAGMIMPSRQTEEYMKLIDSGDVYFTSKRIVFVGSSANKIIPLSKILYITPFSDGIEIGKDTGKKPFFKCSDPETMGLYLARLLKDF